MSTNRNSILAKIIPFIGVGIFLVVIVIAIILFSYVLLIGGAIGLILFCIAYLKQKFFPAKTFTPSKNNRHRTFDNDEFK